MKKPDEKILLLDILLTVCIAILLIALIRRLKNNEFNILLYFNINDIFLLGTFIVFLNFNHKAGMVLSIISFLLFLIIIILFLPERLFKISTFIRLFACSALVYQVFVKDKR
jgi:hypothetical protein